MRFLLSGFLFVSLCLLLTACNGPEGDVDANGNGETSAGGPAATTALTEVLREPQLQLRLSGAKESSGEANYSRNGEMILGGAGDASVTYEIGLLKKGDHPERLTLDLRPGRSGEANCRLLLAISGMEEWQEYELAASDKPVELIVKDDGLLADSDSSLLLRFVCDEGSGIRIGGLDVEMFLTSSEAVLLEADIPARDAEGVDIRVPMRAKDADGRIASAFRGVATMYVTLDDSVMHVPINFNSGLADCSFKLSPAGMYEVQFLSEMQEPIITSLEIYPTPLPVYEISVQQADYARFDTIDFSGLEHHGTLFVNGDAGRKAVVRGEATDLAESSRRSLRLEFPQAFADPQYGYPRDSMELRWSEHDPTQLRAMLATAIFAGADLPVARLRPVHLRVNGIYQGVYIDTEVLDDAWLESRGLGDNAELYVIAGTGSLNPREDLVYFDELFTRVRNPAAGMDQMNEMLKEVALVLPEVPEAQRFATVQPMIDTKAMFDYFLALSMTSANDNYRSNYGVLHSGEPGGWSMLATDLSLTFGITSTNNPVTDPAGFSPINDMDMVGSIKENILLRVLLNCPDSQELIMERMLELLDGKLGEETVLELLDDYWQEIRVDMLADQAAGATEEELEAQIEGIRGNIREHWEYLRMQVDANAVDHSGHDH